GSASRGILFKGGNVFSKLKSADTIALDKTGTLTTGELSVKSYEAVGIDKEEFFYLVSVTEYASNHPIAKCLKKLSDRSHIPESAEEFAGEGTVAEFDGITAIVGNERLMKRFGVKIPDGLFASVYVAKSNTFVGCFQLSDGIKSETKDVLSQLYSSGIKRQAILSGDKEENVLAVANDLDIKEAYYKLTPEEKYKKLDEMITCSNGGVIYVGDGINDAPSIARADVGIAMGGVGQDSAIESADVVIMTDELGKIYEARKIATKTLSIAKQNIVFALGIKILVMILGALGVTNMLLAVFADVGVAVLAILNSMRALSYSKRSKK
ncbi:MAG: HAD-IC family P-type ATPase, partial [Clostridia bacterium]|nr:HAD-IC family P-type ATPase [Clostridia bacterium]